MRILLTGTSYFPEFSAGTEVYMRYVSRYLVEHGDNVRIACGGSEQPGMRTEPKWLRCDSDFEGIKVTRVLRNSSRSLERSFHPRRLGTPRNLGAPFPRS